MSRAWILKEPEVNWELYLGKGREAEGEEVTVELINGALWSGVSVGDEVLLCAVDSRLTCKLFGLGLVVMKPPWPGPPRPYELVIRVELALDVKGRGAGQCTPERAGVELGSGQLDGREPLLDYQAERIKECIRLAKAAKGRRPRSSTLSAPQDLHRELVDVIRDLGTSLGFEVKEEFPLDFLDNRSDAVFLCYGRPVAFWEVLVHGDLYKDLVVMEALARRYLSGGNNDEVGLFYVVSGEDEYKKAYEVVNKACRDLAGRLVILRPHELRALREAVKGSSAGHSVIGVNWGVDGALTAALEGLRRLRELRCGPATRTR